MKDPLKATALFQHLLSRTLETVVPAVKARSLEVYCISATKQAVRFPLEEQ